MSERDPAITQLLVDYRHGDAEALDKLLPLVYDQLRHLAGGFLRGERPGHTLAATALVHEAYMKLVGSEVNYQDRVHFFSVAARVMRRLLVDHARTKNRGKRGGGAPKLSLDDAIVVASEPSEELLNLDDALTRLAAFDERKSRVIELMYFGGLTYAETAEALQISETTLHREHVLAKAWLHQQLAAPPPTPGA